MHSTRSRKTGPKRLPSNRRSCPQPPSLSHSPFLILKDSRLCQILLLLHRSRAEPLPLTKLFHFLSHRLNFLSPISFFHLLSFSLLSIPRSNLLPACAAAVQVVWRDAWACKHSETPRPHVPQIVFIVIT